MHDIVRIGKLKLLGEVIKINRDIATIQVYENTTGLIIGEEVIRTRRTVITYVRTRDYRKCI